MGGEFVGEGCRALGYGITEMPVSLALFSSAFAIPFLPLDGMLLGFLLSWHIWGNSVHDMQSQ